jgi:glycosyltransferase involved in cell wall biosynthesis
MNMPKVTIATMTYNSEKFVAQAIESVLAQSFTDFEYLILDDCSLDNIKNGNQSNKDYRPCLYYHNTKSDLNNISEINKRPKTYG